MWFNTIGVVACASKYNGLSSPSIMRKCLLQYINDLYHVTYNIPSLDTELLSTFFSNVCCIAEALRWIPLFSTLFSQYFFRKKVPKHFLTAAITSTGSTCVYL